jgi:cobalt-zinc-cadmium efflux system outer membrane protein
MKTKDVRSGCAPGAVALVLAITAVPISGLAAPAEKEDARPVDRAEGTEVRVTWQDIERLVDEHPRVAAGRQRHAAARAAVDAAGAVPNPSLEGTTAYGQARDGSASRVEWGLELSIPLSWIAGRRAKKKAASAEARVVDAQSMALRRDVLLQLRTLFWSLVYEQERVSALAELSQQTSVLAETVNRRVEKGESRPVEATRVEVEAEKIAGDLSVARSSLDVRRAQLGLWLGVPRDKKLTAVADLEKLPHPITEPRARELVRTGHPTVVVAEARVQALEANLSVERRARVPASSIQAFTDHELDRSAYGVGLAIDLPLWNWNKGGIRRAESALAAGRVELRAERIELESAAVEAVAGCQAGIELATRYRDRIQPGATSAAETIERTYELGEATLLEVLDARRMLLETRTQTLSVLASAQTDCGRLAALVGEELP